MLCSPTVVSSSRSGAVPRWCLLELLEPNRLQPRTQFDDGDLAELAESIRTQGVIQPLIVTPKPGGRYTIVAGERRLRAAQKAGLKEVPVVVRDVTSDQELLELALVENLQRADLNAIEEAEAYATLRERFHLSQQSISERVGRGRTTITNSLRLLRLPEEVQDLLRAGRVTAGQARPLVTVGSRKRQIELARQAADEGLSARQIEAAVKEPEAASRAGKARAGQKEDVHTREASERLTRALQTKVEIRRRGRGGTVRIHFHSEEELMRLFDRLLQS